MSHGKLLSLTLYTLIMFHSSPAQWAQTNGPNGNSQISLSTNGTDLFALTHGGVFRTTNYGKNWVASNSGLTTRNLTPMLAEGSRLILGGFISNNAGQNWTKSSALDLSFTSFARKGNTIFAGTRSRGISISTDNGTSWSVSNSGIPDVVGNMNPIWSIATNGSYIFASVETHGVFRSTNGATWDSVSVGLPNRAITNLLVCGNAIFAGLSSGVYISNNNGASWNASYTGVNIQCLAQCGGHLVAGTTDGVYISADTGTSWVKAVPGLPEWQVVSLTAVDTHLFAITVGGRVSLSTDTGKTWAFADSGLISSEIVSINSLGTNIFAGTRRGGVSISLDNGQNWMVINAGLTSNGTTGIPFTAMTTYGQTLFAGGYPTIYASSNFGSSWIPSGNGVPSGSIQTMITVGTKLFAGTTQYGIYQTADNGLNWFAVNTGLTNLNIRCLVSIGSTIFAGTDSGIFLTTNNGLSWANSSTGIGNSPVLALAASDTVLFASVPLNGVYVSMSGGNSWALASTGLPNLVVRSFATSAPNTFAGTDSGICLSNDNGASWTTVSTGLPINYQPFLVNCLLLSKTHIYAGTSNSSVWRRPLIDFAPARPLLLLPVNTARDVNLPLTFRWRCAPGAAAYRIQLSTISNFAALTKDTAGLVDTTVTIAGLSNAARYYWRVISTNGKGNSGWSPTWSFTTITSIPNTITLFAPSDGNTLLADSVQLTWRKSDTSVTKYQCEVASDSGMTNLILLDSLVTDTTKWVKQMTNHQTYWWRVRGKNVAGWGSYSAKRSFTLNIPVTGVLPHDFKLHSFGAAMGPSIIRYDLPQKSRVTICILTPQGKVIESFFQANQDAGSYSVHFQSIHTLANGFYILLFRAGTFVDKSLFTLTH